VNVLVVVDAVGEAVIFEDLLVVSEALADGLYRAGVELFRIVCDEKDVDVGETGELVDDQVADFVEALFETGSVAGDKVGEGIANFSVVCGELGEDLGC